MKLKYLWILACIFFTGNVLYSQNNSRIKTKKDAELIIPRPHLAPVKSMETYNREVMDTIETQSPGVMIILYSDNTWKYYRDPANIMTSWVFKENWSGDYPNPYKESLISLPEKVSLWVVDSLCEYKCPNQTKVYSPFGYRHRRRHQGVDLPLKKGDKVYAAFAGKVRLSKYYRGYGNLIILRHENGLETFYAHLSKRLVERDQWVEAGQVIGLGGSTGRSTGAHLHFETRYRGFAFDPQWLIDYETGTLRHRLFVLKKKYLDAGSRYVPESENEEEEIYALDNREHEIADSLEAIKKAEIAAEKAAAEKAAAEKAAEKAAIKYHKVRSGDTLYSIARKNRTTISAICRLNPGLTSKTNLKIGRRIRVK